MARPKGGFGQATARYAWLGVVFGCCFPLGATVLDLALQGLPLTLAQALRVQATQPLHWIIDTAPVFLGLLAALIGRRQDTNEDLNTRLRSRVGELSKANADLATQIAERVRAEAALRYRVELQKLIAAISNSFIRVKPSEIDDALQHALKTIGEFTSADLATIFLLSETGGLLEESRGWRKGEAATQAPCVDLAPGDSCPWLMGKLRTGATVSVPRTADLPPEATAEKNALEKRGVRSFIAVPISYTRRLKGFIALQCVESERAWTDEIVGLLKVTGEICINALERRHADQRMRLQAAALESAANAIVITDREGTIQWVNPAFLELTGYQLHEVLGGNPRLLKSGKHDEPKYREIWDTILAGQVWHGEMINRRKDGSLYDEEMTITPVRDERGEISEFIAIKQDVTERTRAREALVRARETALDMSRLKSGFLANMSHEIRTPMNGVIGMLDLALDTDLDPEQADYLGTARSSAEGLLKILNDILDFSKIEAGKLDLESIPFSLRNGLESALKTLAPKANQKGIELALRVKPDLPDAFIGDPGRLRQVVVNLLQNAVKFTERGEVIVTVTASDVSDQTATIHVEVSDTGIGIPADKRPLIFDAFAQADGSTTRRYGGTGLGLAISSQLVGMMGGRVWVDSEVGKGSRFHFTLPLRLDNDPASPLLLIDRSDLEGLRVLVAEGNATARQILTDHLEAWRMDSVAVQDGPTALETLQRTEPSGRPFDLVVLDRDLPGIDGIALAEEIRNDASLAATRLLLLASPGKPGEGARCRELSIDGYLPKPVSPSGLLEAIQAVLGATTGSGNGVLVTRHSLRESRTRLRILLAEDNSVNRIVARRLLEKHGHGVVGVENGRRALEAMDSQQFDLVLMDVQMPEMDGFEATAAIRSKEEGTGSRIPIIALTAHAMKGDRERCLQAGMDAYVSKPIDAAELLGIIDRLKGSSGSSVEGEAMDSRPSSARFNRDSALEQMGGDTELLVEVVQLFLDDAPKKLEDVRDSVSRLDANGIERAAHSLKGALGSLAAEAAAQAALRLECMAREDDLGGVGEALAHLESELDQLGSELSALVEQEARL